MSPSTQTAPARSSSAAKPARRAAVWTLGICAGLAAFMIALSLFPTDEDPTAETSPALGVTHAETLVMVGSVAFVIAVVYVIAFVCVQLSSRARDPR